MKLSVSVPDELLDRARERQPDLNNSRLIQEALEAWTHGGSRAGYSLERPEGAGSAFTKAKERLAREARKEFEEGYLSAIEAAESLPWHSIESLASQRFDVNRWVQGYLNGLLATAMGELPPGASGAGPEIMEPLEKALGALASPQEWGDGHPRFSPSAPYLRGFAQAMRDLWSEVNDGGAPSNETDQEVAAG